jgi:hypothetical protein
VPDAKTVWLYREGLAQAGLVEAFQALQSEGAQVDPSQSARADDSAHQHRLSDADLLHGRCHACAAARWGSAAGAHG